MIDQPLVEDQSSDRRSERRIGEHPDIREQALDSEKILELMAIKLFTCEIHFMSFSQRLFDRVYCDTFSPSFHAEPWMDDEDSHVCDRR